MDKTIGCAPIYFCGAMIFLVSGCFLLYFGYPIIGTAIGVPGIILLIITLYVWGVTYGIKKGQIPVVLQIDNERENYVKNPPPGKSVIKKKGNKHKRQ